MAKDNQIAKKTDTRHSLKGSSLWGVLWFILLLLIDQLTKLVADAYFSAEGAPQSIKIIPGWIELCQHYNTGIAFSGLDDAAPWVKILLIVGTAALMALFSVFYFKTDKRRSFLRIAIVLIVAGGVGNLIDRLYFKMWLPNTEFGVRDMVMVDFQIFDFGICNFADFFISAGAVMLVLSIAFFDTDAFIPLGKYKALAEEAEKEKEEKEKAQQKEKQPKNSTDGDKRSAREIVWREVENTPTETSAGDNCTQSVMQAQAEAEQAQLQTDGTAHSVTENNDAGNEKNNG